MKSNNRVKITGVIFVVIFLITIACNLPIHDLAYNELQTGIKMVTEDAWQAELSEINQKIDESFTGKNDYSVSVPEGIKNNSKCDQGHPTNKNVTTYNTIDRRLGEESLIDDKVIIKEEGKTFIYHLASNLKPNIFCRETDNLLVECVYLSDKGYNIRVFDEPYSGSFLPYALDNLPACHELNYRWEGQGDQSLNLDLELRLTEVPGKWDINQCNAMSDIQVMQVDFSEGQKYDEDGGYLEYTFCEFTTVFKNTGGFPVSILYYHNHYDETIDYSEWVKVSARQPGEEFSSYDFVDKYESNDYVTISTVDRYAAIYDVPNCSWIKEGGIHYDIVSILEVNVPPCTVISPFVDRDFGTVPNYLEELIKD